MIRYVRHHKVLAHQRKSLLHTFPFFDLRSEYVRVVHLLKVVKEVFRFLGGGWSVGVTPNFAERLEIHTKGVLSNLAAAEIL